MNKRAKIAICPLDMMERRVAQTSASHLVSLINEQMMPATPKGLESGHHLKLSMNDVVVPVAGCILPSAQHVEKLIDFVSAWDQKNPMVIHCWAGISRSTAAAFIALCVLNPQYDEMLVARYLRTMSSTATPNERLVLCADEILRRDGRMVEAIATIGRGEPASQDPSFFTQAKLEGSL